MRGDQIGAGARGVGLDGSRGKMEVCSAGGRARSVFQMGARQVGPSMWYPIPYLVLHPPIRYPIPDKGYPLGSTGWHETTLTSHQSGILYSLIFFICDALS